MNASPDVPHFTPVADRALLVEFGTEVDDVVNDAVLALDRVLSTSALDGLVEVVPAFVNLLIVFDPLVTDHGIVESAVRGLLPQRTTVEHRPTPRIVTICYEQDVAPDLPAVAAACDLSVEAVIAAHLAGHYRVAMYGFAPGYAYLSGIDESIRVPRKPAPVRGVAAGSVIIAGPQCLVTTIEMPTGWSIIGSSSTQILRDDPARPFLFDVGDRVVFERVDLATHERLIVEGTR